MMNLKLEDMEIPEVLRYKCPHCSKEHRELKWAKECMEYHIKSRDIRIDFFKNNFTLQQIYEKYGKGFYYTYWRNMTDKQKTITKDNCFKIEHWQLCRKPAYKIVEIDGHGIIKLGGYGGWMGYFGAKQFLKSLTDPRPAEELYVHGE